MQKYLIDYKLLLTIGKFAVLQNYCFDINVQVAGCKENHVLQLASRLEIRIYTCSSRRRNKVGISQLKIHAAQITRTSLEVLILNTTDQQATIPT